MTENNNLVRIFENEQFGNVRVVMRDDEPWFVAADVCRALDVGNPSQALTRLDEDEKMTTLISNEGAASGKSSMAFVNEPGLYALVLSSRKKEARAFKRWITHEVIPDIRKHGMYMTSSIVQQVVGNPILLSWPLLMLMRKIGVRLQSERLKNKSRWCSLRIMWRTPAI